MSRRDTPYGCECSGYPVRKRQEIGEKTGIIKIELRAFNQSFVEISKMGS
jgi:hypothetical protein